MPLFTRLPRAAIVGTILGSGFDLVGLAEPRPDERFRRADPEEYEKLSRMPGLLCLEIRKPDVG